jgi:hypothetical protein
VEIKNSKVTVYHNPTLIAADFEQRIKDEFELDDEALTIRFISDYSRHYKTNSN